MLESASVDTEVVPDGKKVDTLRACLGGNNNVGDGRNVLHVASNFSQRDTQEHPP